jgi:prevent-host-death family protein
MGITTISSRTFNQDIGSAKRAALEGPVFITDRGHPAHVLLSIDEYQKITEQKTSIVELLAMPEAADIDFEPDILNNDISKAEDFS